MDLEQLSKRIHDRSPRILSTPHDAAVAAILCPRSNGLELLYIERMRMPNDPWSGHIAFPGGRVETYDASLRATAERETLEEIDLHLQKEHYIGRLDDLQGASLPVQVAAFVYAIDESHAALSPNDEVHRAFWRPLEALCEPSRQCHHMLSKDGDHRPMPAIDVLGTKKPLLWGITYRFTAQLVHLLGHSLPLHVSAEGDSP
jgi:8-oxo-dGTP pyrophosphatase MutT (NUDIX family)